MSAIICRNQEEVWIFAILNLNKAAELSLASPLLK